MSGRTLFPLLLLLAGCRGEQVDEAPADAGATDGAGDVATDCTPIPGNLIQNPSFELTNSAGLLTGWLKDPIDSLVQRTGGAVHCQHWAEAKYPPAVSSKFYFGQEVTLDKPVSVGQKVLATAWVRSVDGELDVVLAVGIRGTDSVIKEYTLPADGSWKQLAIEWTVSTATDTLFVDVASPISRPRTLGLDQFSLVLQP